ncbi:YaiI/YqxD family protein [Candidatus Marinamargulisbacteria bacterium SCGC AAA071-K20]|nr:YaiI/YqxD family protein [Candidatus Marinamargulisbacteria bacterium SCGC AAA071-K20]
MRSQKKITIYIDGDAFPNRLKKILFSAINRLELDTVIISNKIISIGQSNYTRYILVDEGADKADDRIVDMVDEGDLVITSDIPLADRVITKKAVVIDHRGGVLNDHNIKEHLATRNLMQALRDSGERTKGPDPFGQKDVQLFANELNSFLMKRIRNHHL